MKALNTVLKILTALAAIAGAIYIVATYGEEIVAWAKRMLAALPKCPRKDSEAAQITVDCDEAAVPAQAAEVAPEAAAEEAPAEEAAPEVVVSEHEPVAEETDFAE